MTDDNRKLPEWEEAFTEYAKKDAPDLLPGILAKINSEAESPLTVVSTKESAKPAKKPFWMTLIPALFMTVVCSTFLLISKQAFGLNPTVAYTGSVIVLVVAVAWFFRWLKNQKSDSAQPLS